MRVKRGFKARRRRNRMYELASGFRGRSKNTIRQATQRAEKALTYVYRDRKVRKRDFRSLWITRINAALEGSDISYSKFICGLKRAGIELDRKILADLGATAPESFAAVADLAKSQVQNAA